MSYTFICLDFEKPLTNTFPVRIGKSKYVGDLKKVIKNELDFTNITASDLRLWKVEIPTDNEEELQNLTLPENAALVGAKEIKYYWNSIPPKDNIHIIIKPPATTPISQASPYLSQDFTIKFDEMYKKITQQAIETISISKVSTENFQLFEAHLNLRFETVFYDNVHLPTPSNVSIPAFKWIEKQSELVHKEEYMNWLRKYIPLTGHRVWHDVGNNKQLLNYKNPRLPFIIHGGTDVVVVNDFDIKGKTVPEGIFAVLELKKTVERRHLMQVILKMFVADSLTSSDRKVFGILSDLVDDWHILWFEEMKIKNWVAPNRDIAVEVISRLLRDSSGVDMEDTSIIIPGSIRIKLDTMLPVNTSLTDDVARMEDVYDVMSKEEIWRHKVGMASEIVRNMPSFMSMYG